MRKDDEGKIYINTWELVVYTNGKSKKNGIAYSLKMSSYLFTRGSRCTDVQMFYLTVRGSSNNITSL